MLLLVITFLALTSNGIADLSSEYAHHAVLDPAELMKLYWTVDWDKETISFAVEAATTGWVGFGFSSGNGMMVGSDVVIGWVKDSKGYITDRYADARSLPPKDREQNYILTGFQETGKKTVLRFNRKIDTCDPRDRKITEGTTKVVFAFHTEDPKSENDFKLHTLRGSRSILLLNKLDKKQINETGWKSFVLQNKNISIPKKRTTYWCTLIKAPEIKGKHHITKFEPYLQKDNEGFVHHLVVYECHGNYNNSHFGVGFDCLDFANMPLLQCYMVTPSLIAAWGVGGQAFYYPPKAGYPIGMADSPKQYMLEMHYDNPEGIEGRTDSSGVKFYYTSNLRQYDAGMLSVGPSTDSFLVIPPKQESWISVGYCPKECTQEHLNATKLPGKGVNVFAAFLHTHLQGRATWTKHYRDGVELPEIARDENYDFNFQDIQMLRKEAHIKPGDDLVHYCKYQTLDRDKMVVGGQATSQEMCIDFLFYYPRMANIYQFCSSLLYAPLKDFVGKYFPDVNVTYPNPMVGMNITWTEDMVSDLRSRMDNAMGSTALCKGWGKYEWLPNPKVTKPLPPTKSPCLQPTLGDPEGEGSFVSASRSLVVLLFATYIVFFVIN